MAEIWDQPIRLIQEDIQDMIDITRLFNGVPDEMTDEDILAEHAKFGLKPPIG